MGWVGSFFFFFSFGNLPFGDICYLFPANIAECLYLLLFLVLSFSFVLVIFFLSSYSPCFFLVFFSSCWSPCRFPLFRLFFFGVISSFWGVDIVVTFFLIRRFNIKISLFSFFFLSAFLSFPFWYSSFRSLSVLFLPFPLFPSLSFFVPYYFWKPCKERVTPPSSNRDLFWREE